MQGDTELLAHRRVHGDGHDDVHRRSEREADDSVGPRRAPRPLAAGTCHTGFEQVLLVIVKEVEEAARVCLFGGVLEGARKHAVAVPGESVAFRRWQWGWHCRRREL